MKQSRELRGPLTRTHTHSCSQGSRQGVQTSEPAPSTGSSGAATQGDRGRGILVSRGTGRPGCSRDATAGAQCSAGSRRQPREGSVRGRPLPVAPPWPRAWPAARLKSTYSSPKGVWGPEAPTPASAQARGPGSIAGTAGIAPRPRTGAGREHAAVTARRQTARAGGGGARAHVQGQSSTAQSQIGPRQGPRAAGCCTE